MLRIAVLVSGGGTNLQAIMDAVADEKSQIQRLQQSSAIIKMPMPWSVPQKQVFQIVVSLRKTMRTEHSFMRHFWLHWMRRRWI